VLDRAEACAASQCDGFDEATAVVIHGDAHADNVLEDLRGGFKLIDPDAMLSHPAHDLAIPLRDWNEELLSGDAPARVRSWCAQLSEQSGAPADDIWEWAFLERVSTGLYLLRLGEPAGQSFLAVADRLLDG
jgi:streptomycin 6-kinase